MNPIHWNIKSFEKLTNIELYNIMRLRSEVFVIEQQCIYMDADGKDINCIHVMGIDQHNNLIAYSRIVPAGISFQEVSIGRVLSSKKYRGIGAGKELIDKSISVINNFYGEVPIRIGAQSYLKNFYEKFDFVVVSSEYLEDDIPHLEMLRNGTDHL